MTIREFLKSRHVPHEPLLHTPSASAAHLAQSVHVSGGRVAKAVLVRAGTGYALAVLPATHRIDLGKLGAALRATHVEIASEDEVEAVFFDCERGAVPPFGSLYRMTTVVDASLSGGSEIVIEGNTRHEGLKMRYRDFEAIERPIRARFAEPIAPRRRRSSHRRAG
jgi:Ala-tRNA(Pro) deacylase